MSPITQTELNRFHFYRCHSLIPPILCRASRSISVQRIFENQWPLFRITNLDKKKTTAATRFLQQIPNCSRFMQEFNRHFTKELQFDAVKIPYRLVENCTVWNLREVYRMGFSMEFDYNLHAQRIGISQYGQLPVHKIALYYLTGWQTNKMSSGSLWKLYCTRPISTTERFLEIL